jgi:hypothetical protein
MASFVNLVVGGLVAVALVLACWLLVGLIEDAQRRPSR